MDVEKTIQFLLAQQARFDARQAEFDTRQAEFDARQVKFEEDIALINNIMAGVAIAQQRTNAILETLAEKHVETEQKLQAVISAIERHIAHHE